MDFVYRLKDSINAISELPMQLKVGYLVENDSFAIRAIPGGKVIREYYDNVKDESLNYEIAIKTKDQALALNMMETVQSYLENLEELSSNDESFEFQNLEISNKPYLSGQDEQDFFYYMLNITAFLTTLKKRK